MESEFSTTVPLLFELLVGFALSIEAVGAVIDYFRDRSRKAGIAEAAAFDKAAAAVAANSNLRETAPELKQASV